MFDTMSRKYLSTYGSSWVKTPNFERLKTRTLQFDNFFSGSLPCMPARRDLHTGRYNFLHRSWGPIEPFDISAIELLKNNGVYTHIVTDHSHYWEDGGATYLPRYTTWEGFRGQEGDRFIGVVDHEKIDIPPQLASNKKGESLYFNWANRSEVQDESDYSSVKTVKAGIEFIQRNKESDNWFLQVECFDPHEPFDVPQRFLDMYDDDYVGAQFDWPSYAPVVETEAEKRHIRKRYAALISMCDHYLGKILDEMDAHNMWEDTMLIVNTDHGFLMGEHDWWGKNIQPCYNEVSHLPFYLYDPRTPHVNETRTALSQMIDIGPTLLDFFGLHKPVEMLGKSLSSIVKDDSEIREGVLFGTFGGHVNVSDGKKVYMRASISPQNKPLYEYTLMPTKMRGFFSEKSLKNYTLTKEFSFLRGMQVMKVEGMSFSSSYQFGNKLFSIENDYQQQNPLDDPKTEVEMIELMRQLMLENEAPEEQYERLGMFYDKKMDVETLAEQQRQKQLNEKIDVTFALTNKQKAQILFLKNMSPIAQEEGLEMALQEVELEMALNNAYDASLNKDIDQIILTLVEQTADKLAMKPEHKKMMLNLLKYADKRD